MKLFWWNLVETPGRPCHKFFGITPGPFNEPSRWALLEIAWWIYYKFDITSFLLEFAKIFWQILQNSLVNYPTSSSTTSQSSLFGELCYKLLPGELCYKFLNTLTMQPSSWITSQLFSETSTKLPGEFRCKFLDRLNVSSQYVWDKLSCRPGLSWLCQSIACHFLNLLQTPSCITSIIACCVFCWALQKTFGEPTGNITFTAISYCLFLMYS